MDMQIPLNQLKFGHEDGAGINARVVGRQDGIAELAANIYANRSEKRPTGLIENLVVKDAGDGFYSVANGNRRLAALQMIGGDAELPIPCTLHEVDAAKAFEYSLTTAVTARQLHPVDQYEAFARLDETGKTHEEIAQQYGMTEKEVRQALALGRLSPKIREAWRAGDIKAEAARAFTLGLDHKTQDMAFDKLKKEGYISEGYVKKELGAGAVDADVTQLLDVVGIEAYRNAGGVVTEDLFGTSHIISNEVLLKQMARQLLIAKCEELQADGWAWAEINDDLPHGARFWSQSQPKSLDYQGDEKARYEAADAKLQALEDDSNLSYNEEEELQEKIEAEMAEITSAVRARSFEPKKKKQLGCIVDVENGRIVILYGVKKPDEARLPSQEPADEPAKPGKKAAAATPAEADEADISQALLHRLSIQLTKAAATALIQDEQLALSVLIAGVGCYSNCGVKASISGLGSRDNRGLLGAEDMKRALPLAQKLKPAERISLLTQLAANALDFQHTSTDHNDPHDGAMTIVNAIDAKAFNAAARGAFDAKDYFAGVSKALSLKAIEEAMGPDMARQQAKNGKPDIVAFAIENVPKTGWLPLQLRGKGYDGPPVAKGKVVALAAERAKKPASARPVMEVALDKAKKALVPLKRAAAARKAVKKTAKKTSAKKKKR